MHIKQVRIQGFKSYKEQISTDPFDPRLNVVVGKNGSGKSNFFKAIEFVLGDEEEYKRLGAQGRQQLLHEGTGDRVVQAWVEIIFDNTDQRIPVDTEEFVLRRVVGTKKDQYLLNGKPTTKQDVTNMLETAGFSAGNPYYIVKQGKVTEMATAKDKKRLELLREVAGTRVYDDKRTESENILQTTEENIEDVKRVLDTIEEKLKALESEKEELRKHQQLDKRRRALEHTVYNREYDEVNTKLVKLREQRQRKDEEVNKCRADLKKETNRMQRLEADNAEAASIMDKTQDEIDQLSAEITDCESQQTRLQLRIDDLDRKIAELKTNQTESLAEFQRLQADSIRVQQEIDALREPLDDAQKAEKDARNELEQNERRVRDLQKKRGHGQRFKTREERNKYLETEVRKLGTYVKKQEGTKKNLEKYIEEDSKTVAQLEQNIQALEISTKEAQDNIVRANDEHYQLKKLRDDLQQARSTKQNEENNLQKNLTNLRRELAKKEQKYKNSVGANSLRGAEGVQQVIRRLGERVSSRYHGQLIEHVNCVEAVYNAVDVVGGGKLFNHVVDNDVTATEIVEEFNRLKLPGELSMIPLSLLANARGISADKMEQIQAKFGNEVRLMSELVRADHDTYEPAVRSVFAKYVLCRKLDVATQVCREFDVDCVTQEGYTVQRNGVMSGGYLDRSVSKLAYHQEVRTLRSDLEAREQEYSSMRAEMEHDEDAWRRATNDFARKETEVARRRKDLDQMKAQLSQCRDALRRKRDDIAQRQKSLAEIESQLESLREQVDSFNREMESELTTALSAAEQAELAEKEAALREQRQKVGRLANQTNKLEAQVSEKTTFLEENVQRRIEELHMRTEDFETNETEQLRNSLRSDQEQLESRLDLLQENLRAKHQRMAEKKRAQQQVADDLDGVMKAERAAREKLGEVTRELEQHAAKQVQLERTRDDALEKLRNLGAVPTGPEFAALRSESLRSVSKKLDECNAELKKFSHVNQRALDQFIQFSEDETKFQKRLKELHDNKRAIEDLLSSLEKQKAAAIEHTFNQLNHYFSEIFNRLTSGGTGRLKLNEKAEGSGQSAGGNLTNSSRTQSNGTMTSSHSRINSDAASNSTSSDMFNIDNYDGVQILCSFTGPGGGEMKDMEQLSGGQKTLVALGLVFAIQRCDPAPFYLFDEVDAALDADYRSAVAKTIAFLSEKAQFIVTTFRPELLSTAQKFYGVRFDRKLKVSRLMSVTSERAHEFVHEDYQDAPGAGVGVGNETFQQQNVVPVLRGRGGRSRAAAEQQVVAEEAEEIGNDDVEHDGDVEMADESVVIGGSRSKRSLRNHASARSTSREPMDSQDDSEV